MSVINADNIIILFKLNPLSFVVFAKSILSYRHNRRNLDFRSGTVRYYQYLVLKVVALVRLRVFFLLLIQKKETKENATPLSLNPSVLAPHLDGCGTRAFSAQTVLAAFHLPLKPKARHRGFKIKTSYL
jgi:hypothetical protein